MGQRNIKRGSIYKVRKKSRFSLGGEKIGSCFLVFHDIRFQLIEMETCVKDRLELEAY